MTANEKFKQVVSFKRPDEPLRWYAYTMWPQLLEEWASQGHDIMSLKLERPNMIPGNPGASGIPYNPPFIDTILEDNGDDTVIACDTKGIVQKRSRSNGLISQYISHPVCDRDSFLRIKERMDYTTHDKGFDYSRISKEFLYNPETNCLFICGVFGFLRNLFGEEALSYAFYDMPELIHEICAHWLTYYKGICKPLVSDMRVDYVMFFEDIAYKNGCLISPAMFKEFLTPYFKDIMQFFKAFNINHFMVDTDGRVDEVLPLYIECGFNMMDPFERTEGNDILRLADLYPELILWGGIDKRVLNGSQEDIRHEVETIVPPLLKRGGYIPGIDHLMLPPVSFTNFKYFAELIDKEWESI